ncbi:MAG: YrdB family protein [Acidimicrobiales bacterium]|nr:YrdB family protein [Acidimicrobiales bacterium]
MQPPTMPGWNLTLRFGLEVAALLGIGIAAWQVTDGPVRWAAVVAAPLAAASVWGVFNVPADPSRSGEAPVVVPGVLRLGLEMGVLGAGGAGFLVGGLRLVALVFVLLVLVHYSLSASRIRWLLHH